jgi:hypothetical protein
VEILIREKCDAARAQLSKLVSKEGDLPFTLNDHYFTDRYGLTTPPSSNMCGIKGRPQAMQYTQALLELSASNSNRRRLTRDEIMTVI